MAISFQSLAFLLEVISAIKIDFIITWPCSLEMVCAALALGGFGDNSPQSDPARSQWVGPVLESSSPDLHSSHRAKQKGQEQRG